MNDLLGIVIEGIIVFVVVFVVEYLILIRKNKEYKKNDIPSEIEYIIKTYKVDIEKLEFKKVVNTFALVNSLIMTIVFLIISNLIKGVMWQLLIGFALLCISILLAYGLIGKHYRKVSDKDV